VADFGRPETGPVTGEIALPAELSGMLDLIAYSSRGTSTIHVTDEAARIQRTYRLTAETCRKAHTGVATSVNPM
jgi:hypothetical protein